MKYKLSPEKLDQAADRARERVSNYTDALLKELLCHARKQMNSLTREERQKLFEEGMKIVNGEK